MKSPFKFLDAYQAEDAAIFFGREEEVNQLYELTFKSPLVLLYGLSGTGKTSLVQCGLAARFDGPDWYPFFIRREENINESLINHLREVFPDDENWSETDLPQNIRILFEEYLRPLYLVFDQFEELFIFGDTEEQMNFARNLSLLTQSALPCKVILVIREEYLGQIYYLEKILPEIYDYRIRVEPMGLKSFRQVVVGSFTSFQVRLPDEDRIANLIYQQLTGGKSGIQLPYLQVYLDLLYKSAFREKYPQAEEIPQPLPELTISADAVESLGAIENVLGYFLEEQSDLIQRKIREKYPQSDPDLVHNFLDALVSEEGTKRPLYYTKDEDQWQLQSKGAESLRQLSPGLLGDLISRLEKARLIRVRTEFLELSHDSLAGLIDQERGEFQRMVNLHFNRIVYAYRTFTGTQEYLSRAALNAMSPYRAALWKRLDAPLRKFIEQSEVEAEARERLEIQREKRKRRNAIIVAVAGIGLSILATIGFIGARKNAELARQQAFEAYLNFGENYKLEWRFEAAFSQLETADSLARTTPEKQRLQNLRQQWSEIQRLKEASDLQMKSGNYKRAKEYIDQAIGISEDRSLTLRQTQIQDTIRSMIDFFLESGNRNERDGDLESALEKYNRVLELDPGIPRAQEKVKELRQRLGLEN